MPRDKQGEKREGGCVEIITLREDNAGRIGLQLVMQPKLVIKNFTYSYVVLPDPERRCDVKLSPIC